MGVGLLRLLVVPGLVPGIHVPFLPELTKDVDGRDKPGHDGERITTAASAVFRQSR
jgi:hypothetical protein